MQKPPYLGARVTIGVSPVLAFVFGLNEGDRCNLMLFHPDGTQEPRFNVPESRTPSDDAWTWMAGEPGTPRAPRVTDSVLFHEAGGPYAAVVVKVNPPDGFGGGDTVDLVTFGSRSVYFQPGVRCGVYGAPPEPGTWSWPDGSPTPLAAVPLNVTGQGFTFKEAYAQDVKELVPGLGVAECQPGPPLTMARIHEQFQNTYVQRGVVQTDDHATHLKLAQEAQRAPDQDKHPAVCISCGKSDTQERMVAVGKHFVHGWCVRDNAGVLLPAGSFGWAVEALKEGRRVTRKGWNGKGMWLALQVPDAGSKMTLPYIYMSTAQGSLVPWLASQTDVLAMDWVLA